MTLAKELNDKMTLLQSKNNDIRHIDTNVSKKSIVIDIEYYNADLKLDKKLSTLYTLKSWLASHRYIKQNQSFVCHSDQHGITHTSIRYEKQ